MALYESYDEDIDESVDTDEEYDVEDYDESDDDSGEDFDEARRRHGRRSRRDRRRHSRNTRSRPKGAVTSGSVKKAFSYVNDDVKRLQTKIKDNQAAKTSQLSVAMITKALIPDSIDLSKLALPLDGSPPDSITKAELETALKSLQINDNFLLQIIAELIGAEMGGGAKIDFKKLILPIGAALLIRNSNISLNNLFQNNAASYANDFSKTNDGTSQKSLSTFFQQPTNIFLVIALAYFVMKKN